MQCLTIHRLRQKRNRQLQQGYQAGSCFKEYRSKTPRVFHNSPTFLNEMINFLILCN